MTHVIIMFVGIWYLRNRLDQTIWSIQAAPLFLHLFEIAFPSPKFPPKTRVLVGFSFQAIHPCVLSALICDQDIDRLFFICPSKETGGES